MGSNFVRVGEGGKPDPPTTPFPLLRDFIFFSDDKTSAPHVFKNCSFIPRAYFETSLVMVSYYGYEIWRHK